MAILFICSLGSIHMIGQAPYDRWRFTPLLPHLFGIAFVLAGVATRPDAWPFFCLILPLTVILHILKVRVGRLER